MVQAKACNPHTIKTMEVFMKTLTLLIQLLKQLNRLLELLQQFF